MARQEENIGFEQLKRELKQKTVGNFYVFCGSEAYLRTAYLQRLHELLIEPFAEEFNFRRFNGDNLTPQALSEGLNALPMLSQRTMIQIDDVDFFGMNEEDRKTYGALLADIPVDCTVVLVYDTVEYAPPKKDKYLTETMAKALVVSFSKPTERELCGWIVRHFKPHGKSLSYETCVYLISRTGGDMTTLSGEIEKVAAYESGDVITREDVDAVVEPVLEAKIFDLTDALCEGDYDRAMLELFVLIQRQEASNGAPASGSEQRRKVASGILAAISGQFRNIQMAKTLSSRGMTTLDLEKFGVSPYPAKKAFTYARRLSEAFCDKAVLLCLETDAQMKRSVDEETRLLELLILRLAQEARR